MPCLPNPEYQPTATGLTPNAVHDFFAGLALDNLYSYPDLQLCLPDISYNEELDSSAFESMIQNVIDLQAVECCDDDVEDKVCGIKFFYEGDEIDFNDYNNDCESLNKATTYKVKTFEDDDELKEEGYFPFHKGGMYFIYIDSCPCQYYGLSV